MEEIDMTLRPRIPRPGLALSTQSPSLRLIAGDASDRKFYRYQTETESLICMVFPKWSGGYGGDPLSWLGMQEALLSFGLPVPKVVVVNSKECAIWTEDFGDHFLNYQVGQSALDHKDPEHRETIGYYLQALQLLLDAQYPKVKDPIDHPALTRAFDREKLLFELKFFAKHFLKDFLKLPKMPKGVGQDFERLAETLAERPRVLCHRDYHMRNLLIRHGKVNWIDFQDARMGPHTYDVVSLVRDSYLKMKPQTRAMLKLKYFEELQFRQELGQFPRMSWEDYDSEYLLMGLQRNIKAIGSFAYLHLVKSKKMYLSYIQNTLNTITEESPPDLLQNHGLVHLGALLHDLSCGKLKSRLENTLDNLGVDSF